jgi:hypothetical protein
MKKLLSFLVASIIWIVGIGQVAIQAEDAKKHIGEVVTLCGKIYTAKYLKDAANQPTLLNLGGSYPNQLVTIAIFETDRKSFPFSPEDYYVNLDVCVTGKLIEYKGSPEIVVQSPDQIKLQLANTSNASPSVKKDAEPAKKTEPEQTKPKEPEQSKSKTEGQPDKTEKPSGDEFEVKLTNDVNLRTGPSPDYGVVTLLKAGSLVAVIRSNNGWSYVLVKKGTPKPVNGYIKNNVLK